MNRTTTRRLVLILGDQLDRESAALDDLDSRRDCIWMAEVAEESTHVPSHKARIALFLSAMRHFRNWLEEQGYRVSYTELDDSANKGTLAGELRRAIEQFHPDSLVLVKPGDYRVEQSLQDVADELGLPLEIREDRHFLATLQEFAEHAKGRKQLRLEYYYRELRRKHDCLMDQGEPEGGKWNYDADNRKSFPSSGPDQIPPPIGFPPDKTTRAVLKLVSERFPSHPGSLDHFDWPVTFEDAQTALEDFIENRLPDFGKYQDAMWTDRPFLNHSLLSTSLNLKLLNPRDVLRGAAQAYYDGHVPLASAEGFIRQVLGWREYVRGLYWYTMPDYLERNALNATGDLPEFYWTGETEMECLKQSIGQTLKYGYAHHIQRLMVTGLFSLLLGVDPRQVHEWYLAVYVDAVEWVELPNTLGMSQYADGGVMASKPYVATGKYIKRMSNYCHHCPFDPDAATGENACPFTTLYWDFLKRHESDLADNNRMSLQLRNLERKDAKELKAIRTRAGQLRRKWSDG